MNPRVEYLNECLELEPDGSLRWKARPESHFSSGWQHRAWIGKNAGKRAGNRHRSGNVRVTLDGECLWRTQIVWALTRGSWPASPVHRLNGVKGDDSPDNLTLVPQLTPGAGVRACGERYQARVNQRHLGTFDSLTEAHSAREAAHSERRLGILNPMKTIA